MHNKKNLKSTLLFMTDNKLILLIKIRIYRKACTFVCFVHPVDISIGEVKSCVGFRCVSKWDLPVIAVKYAKRKIYMFITCIFLSYALLFLSLPL